MAYMNSTNVTFLENSLNCLPILYPYWFPMYGVLCPLLAFTTLCTNILVIIVFTMNRMRSPTTILLTALAVSDILAAIVITPMYVYFYSMGNVLNYQEGLPYPLCIYHSMAYKITAVFHAVSIWLTVVLGIQRYIVVAYPIPGRRLCSQKNSVLVIILVFILVLGTYSLWFMEDRFEERTRIDESGLAIPYCLCYQEEVIMFDYSLEKMMKFIRLVFGQFFPCMILLCATIALVQKLVVESHRILDLHKEEDNEMERTDFRLIRRTTVMVILIVITFCLVEIPLSIVFLIDVCDVKIIQLDTKLEIAVISNFCLFITYQVNFWIYVCLSRHFRNNLRRLFRFGKKQWNQNGLNSVNSKSIYSPRILKNRRVSTFH
ncbi:sex peptide receptor-like [Ylistrum balloti]|uniref:sex peptide receptor-like n=1 Tax=Ylistrum balloti TaxID=509963 RepID=UPI002905BEDF|nr:sex peptide receptor-like [Ylistrum balloti]